ncbi:hypothetical protein Nepgr_012813 [Nepenthes gracilis]|uniref:RRP15-like protein n=1 Tax=Nepenthes gracilis TaxID=150966 RepID=A0AAD3SGS4_NEPGR|nr:hypothetical protein Nepgr_012813 [Nepenthes gracilis]
MGRKVDKKTQKLFRKRAREYNSDEEDGDVPDPEARAKPASSRRRKAESNGILNKNEEVEKILDFCEQTIASDEEEEVELQPGITKFTEGCRAFKLAFINIMKRRLDDEPTGPILCAHKKLVAAKLAEEETERKAKREAKKEKHLVEEKGHMKPANFLDSHEKFLIGVATKGVVKLFNAVNKAQNVNRGQTPSRSKDEKVLRTRRKDAFFSELRKASSQPAGTHSKVSSSKGQTDIEEPLWAPLRDTYMLTNSKLKDWDKMEGTAVVDESGLMSEDDSEDDND